MGKRGPQPGTPKTPGSGRKPGSLNKKTKEIFEILKDHNFNLFEEWMMLYDKFRNAKDGDLIAANILNNMAPYIYPKRSWSEHSGPDGDSISINRPLEDIGDDELLQLVPEATKLLLEKNKSGI